MITPTTPTPPEVPPCVAREFVAALRVLSYLFPEP